MAGKFGNPTLLCTLYKNEINTSFFNRYFHITFTVRRILSRVCIIGPIFLSPITIIILNLSAIPIIIADKVF